MIISAQSKQAYNSTPSRPIAAALKSADRCLSRVQSGHVETQKRHREHKFQVCGKLIIVILQEWKSTLRRLQATQLLNAFSYAVEIITGTN